MCSKLLNYKQEISIATGVCINYVYVQRVYILYLTNKED